MLVNKRDFKNSSICCYLYSIYEREKKIVIVIFVCFYLLEENENRIDDIDINIFLFLLQMSSLPSKFEVPIFYPTYDEFENFSSYISKIESYGAHQIGLAKVVPPKEWIARNMGYKQKSIDDTMVENPIKQEVHGKDGLYSVYNIQQRSIKLNQFQKLSSTNRYTTPTTISKDFEKLEKRYWQNLTSISPIYGAGRMKN
jgi:hypothetical protein